MNYRHAFHAGNFADVFKHVILTRILTYLVRKDASLRFIDTHAGPGLYDLHGAEATRSGEWRDGIARLADEIPDPAGDLLRPYLDLVGQLDAQGCPVAYPGSPVLAQMLLRAQDKLTLCEWQKDDAKQLAENLGHDRRVKVLLQNGYASLNALLPPPERRGLVLIDPPFEVPDEFMLLQQALALALRKWRVGTYALWYPVKGQGGERFAAHIMASAIPDVLRLEINIDTPSPSALPGCGMMVINPPFVLESEARILLPVLSRMLAQGPRPSWRADWINRA